MKRFAFLMLILIVGISSSDGQTFHQERTEKIEIQGHTFNAIISGNDTIIMADLEDVSISSPRNFKNRDEYRLYRRYRFYSAKVYPYALKAIKIFQEVEEATQNMRKRKRKRYIKRKYKQLKKEFKTPLKGLTKTQGKILIKMIERELDKPFYDLMKMMRGGFTAAYWNQLAKLYDYDLKKGYKKGDDPILDVGLHHFDISYTKE